MEGSKGPGRKHQLPAETARRWRQDWDRPAACVDTDSLPPPLSHILRVSFFQWEVFFLSVRRWQKTEVAGSVSLASKHTWKQTAQRLVLQEHLVFQRTRLLVDKDQRWHTEAKYRDGGGWQQRNRICKSHDNWVRVVGWGKNTANSYMKFHFIPAKHRREEVICDTQLLCQV